MSLNPRPTDIQDLVEAARQFQTRLEAAKSSHTLPNAEWYPYDTFGALPILESMLREDRRNLLALAGVNPVLDFGCGDGDLAFFLESLGCRVTAFDRQETNYNGTRGIQTLQAAFGSSVRLDVRDLDTNLDFGGHTHGLAICLGVLYHLKNPFGFLEGLARHARHCILSTRIAEVSVRGASIADEPVAYLLDTAEANNDPTNYWIFSESGLRRILARTGWDVCDYTTTGAQQGSDPVRADRDQRAYCMLRSRLAHPSEVELESGWHVMEASSWRWTDRVFSVRLPRISLGPATLRFEFQIPEIVIQSVGPLRLRVNIDGVDLPEREYRTSGSQTYCGEISAAAEPGDSLSIRFELDKTFAPEVPDHRKLGVQVLFWSRSEPTPRALLPITVCPIT